MHEAGCRQQMPKSRPYSALLLPRCSTGHFKGSCPDANHQLPNFEPNEASSGLQLPQPPQSIQPEQFTLGKWVVYGKTVWLPVMAG